MKTAIIAIAITVLSGTFGSDALAAKKTGLKAHGKSSLTLKQKIAKKKKAAAKRAPASVAKRKPAAAKPKVVEARASDPVPALIEPKQVLVGENKVDPNRPLTW